MIMAKKKYNPAYIEQAKKQVERAMFQEPCPQDFADKVFSIRDALKAASSGFGSVCREDDLTHGLRQMLTELLVSRIERQE